MKHLALKIVTVTSAVVLIGALQYKAGAADTGYQYEAIEKARIVQGYAIAPVHLNLANKDTNLVGLGSYLVNAIGGCSDCHTNPTYLPGGNPFMGQTKKVNKAHYLGGGQVFGPFVSRNLTPENGLPAGHPFAEFKTILRTGVDFDHAHPQFGPLLQVMPWPTFQNMNDHDIRAIYEYLRAIPPATPGP